MNETAFGETALWRLGTIAFFSGAVVMSMELCGTRISAPFFGSSLYIWTSMIGVILGALSVGYWLGGRMADCHPQRLPKLLFLAAFGLTLIAIFETPFLATLSNIGLGPRLGALLAASLLFGPTSILLGMVTPFVTRLALDGIAESGRVIGSIYALSTLGSIFGTFITGFYLFSVMGSAGLLLLLAAVMACLPLLLELRRFAGYTLGLLTLLLLLRLGLNAQAKALEDSGLRVRDTSYHRVLVLDQKVEERIKRYLLTDPFGSQSSTYLDQPAELTAPYAEFYDIGVFHAEAVSAEERTFLMLGGGAYSYPKYFELQFPGRTLDIVEIDPELTEIASELFGFRPGPFLRLFHQDARVFLQQHRQQYDAIFFDVFSSAPEIPFHLATEEFFKLVRRRLKDEGLLLINSIGAAEGEASAMLRSLVLTLTQAFPEVELYLSDAQRNPQEVQNILIIASERGLDWTRQPERLQKLRSHRYSPPSLAGAQLLRDEFAPVETLMGGTYKALANKKGPQERP